MRCARGVVQSEEPGTDCYWRQPPTESLKITALQRSTSSVLARVTYATQIAVLTWYVLG